jgi:hypothetical protein
VRYEIRRRCTLTNAFQVPNTKLRLLVPQVHPIVRFQSSILLKLDIRPLQPDISQWTVTLSTAKIPQGLVKHIIRALRVDDIQRLFTICMLTYHAAASSQWHMQLASDYPWLVNIRIF